MNTHLENLMGSKVSFSMRDDDALMVVFERDWALAIFNHWHFRSANDEIGSDSLLIQGKVLSSVCESIDYTKLKFEDMELAVDVRDGACQAPEAMVLYKRGVPMAAW